jgi:hypothetical protein
MALTWRQTRLYTQRVTVWRETETITAGKPSGAWAVIATGVACHLTPNPSQYELQGFVLSEGDNIFTLDVWSFDVAQDIGDGDVLKVTTGNAAILGGFWRIRGDTEPLTYFANAARYIAARLEKAPNGVS